MNSNYPRKVDQNRATKIRRPHPIWGGLAFGTASLFLKHLVTSNTSSGYMLYLPQDSRFMVAAVGSLIFSVISVLVLYASTKWSRKNQGKLLLSATLFAGLYGSKIDDYIRMREFGYEQPFAFYASAFLEATAGWFLIFAPILVLSWMVAHWLRTGLINRPDVSEMEMPQNSSNEQNLAGDETATTVPTVNVEQVNA